MGVTFFKRYKMEIDLRRRVLPEPSLPDGYQLIGWNPKLLETHTSVKYDSFCNELDARVFPCFTSIGGCRRVMSQIVAKQGFLPQATWLAARFDPTRGKTTYCGTIQGLKIESGIGSIQNIGVTPDHRGLGLATCLIYRSLEGFQKAKVQRVQLQVTVENESAVRLYSRLGFEIVKVLYKESPA